MFTETSHVQTKRTGSITSAAPLMFPSCMPLILPVLPSCLILTLKPKEPSPTMRPVNCRLAGDIGEWTVGFTLSGEIDDADFMRSSTGLEECFHADVGERKEANSSGSSSTSICKCLLF